MREKIYLKNLNSRYNFEATEDSSIWFPNTGELIYPQANCVVNFMSRYVAKMLLKISTYLWTFSVNELLLKPRFTDTSSFHSSMYMNNSPRVVVTRHIRRGLQKDLDLAVWKKKKKQELWKIWSGLLYRKDGMSGRGLGAESVLFRHLYTQRTRPLKLYRNV